MSTVLQTERISFRSVAMPVEHGGWGLLLEPVVLALLVQPSAAGFSLAVSAVAAFLFRHPAKIAGFDWIRGKRYPRTRGAEIFAAGYGLVAVAAFAGAISLAGSSFAAPLLAVAPLFMLQFAYDVRNQSRNKIAEISGTVAAAALAPAVAMAGGMKFSLAAGLWLLILLRTFPSVMYIRTRLRLSRDASVSALPVLALHVVAVGVAAAVAWRGALPFLAVVPLVVLLGRAAAGLSPWRRSISAKRLGFTEVFYGLLTVILAAVAYAVQPI